MTTHCYINTQSNELQVWTIFRIPEVRYIGPHDLPNMYAFSPWACGIQVYILGKSFVAMLQLLHVHPTRIQDKLFNSYYVAS